LLLTPLHDADDAKEAQSAWARTLHAMNVLGFTDGEVSAICAVLAAICHLGAAGAILGVLSFLSLFCCNFLQNQPFFTVYGLLCIHACMYYSIVTDDCARHVHFSVFTGCSYRSLRSCSEFFLYSYTTFTFFIILVFFTIT